VLITLAAVRGHAPRGAGSKMVVTRTESYGSIGGGNLEETAITQAKALLEGGAQEPKLFTLTLNPKGGDYGVQCCGGEVTVLLEPIMTSRPTVALFGAGHVGRALAQVLSILPIALYVVDSRPAQLDALTLPPDHAATVTPLPAPVPESAVASLPAGAHLVILTHDHAEDLAVLDTALRRSDLGYLGLIGSSVKWAHFRGELKKLGHAEAALGRVTTPIGLPEVPGKSPQAVAISTAAQLLGHLDLPEPAL